MKSIMEEASTIVKAISQGWERAGKPREFSVKIFQEPERNFIGMTTKNAKIGLFFTAPSSEPQVSTPAQPKHVDRMKKQVPEKPAVKVDPRSANRPKDRPVKATPQDTPSHRVMKNNPVSTVNDASVDREGVDQQERRPSDIWSPEMVDIALNWVKETVAAMELSGITCASTIHKYQLRLTLSKPLSTNEAANKALMRDYSILILQALRNKYKRPLRGFKVILAIAPE